MATNNFLPFCNTNTGTNLPTQGDYLVDPNRDIGAQPGVASSKLNNKPMRQATAITSQLAQYVADKTGADVLDDGDMTRLLAQINAAVLPLAPVITRYTSGSGNHNLTYVFFIDSGSATAGATYTNNSITYTVTETVASGLMLKATGSNIPEFSGTLTKASGTGDATITFYAYRKAVSLNVKLVGGGGGGGGSCTSAGNNGGTGGTGGSTTFGTSLLTAAGGVGGLGTTQGAGGAGGAITINSPAISLTSLAGSKGNSTQEANVANVQLGGGIGGATPFGGGGAGGASAVAGSSPTANSGAGGGGGGAPSTGIAGAGGGSGGYIDAMIVDPDGTSFAYSIGSAGTAGTAGASGFAGAAAAAGFIICIENFQ